MSAHPHSTTIWLNPLRGIVLLCFATCLTLVHWNCTPLPTTSADGGTQPDGAPSQVCIGHTPQAPSTETPTTPPDCGRAAATCPGASMPTWQLKDFQPQSCGYNKTYGLNTFKGKVTLVVLLSAWCGFCRAQIERLEFLRNELDASGQSIHIIAINSADAETDKQAFVDRCAFPLFQDTNETNAWKQHSGQKDDFYLYNTEGKLAAFFSFSNNDTIDLSTPEGYNTIKRAVLKLME